MSVVLYSKADDSNLVPEAASLGDEVHGPSYDIGVGRHDEKLSQLVIEILGVACKSFEYPRPALDFDETDTVVQLRQVRDVFDGDSGGKLDVVAPKRAQVGNGKQLALKVVGGSDGYAGFTHVSRQVLEYNPGSKRQVFVNERGVREG